MDELITEERAGVELAAALGVNPEYVTSVTFEPAGSLLIVRVESTRFVRDVGSMVSFLSNYRLVRIEEPADD